jgi:uncharacterized membrane protein
VDSTGTGTARLTNCCRSTPHQLGSRQEEAEDTSAAQHQRRRRAQRRLLGHVLGLIFLVPLLGAAVGAVLGAWSTSIIDMGISDEFIDEVKQKVTPGTSALFLLTDDTVVSEVESALKDMNAHLIASNLSAEQEAKLREAFTED